MRVVLLAGGGGGARLALGLQDALAPGELTVVGNVGDDVEILGLHVSPDLDSLLYTLAGLVDGERGWGRAGETWNALTAAAAWGGEDWFRLGDLDLGLHLVRTAGVSEGARLSEITARLVERAGLQTRILPATDDRVRTWIVTPTGELPFQEWFVRREHRDEVDAVFYDGSADAEPALGVPEALAAAEAVVIGPSNPFVSIGPILAVGGIRQALEQRRVRCLGVSPLVAGKSVTGPLDRMLLRMTGGTTPSHVAQSYEGLIDALVIDEADAPAESPVDLIVAKTLMRDRSSARQLAQVVLEAACG